MKIITRHDHRTRASLELLLFNSGVPVAAALTRDISNAGFFLRTDYRDFKVEQKLEFELICSRIKAGSHKRFGATIKAMRSDGLVLCFNDQEKDSAFKLVAMVAWVASIDSRRCQSRDRQRLVSIPDIYPLKNQSIW